MALWPRVTCAWRISGHGSCNDVDLLSRLTSINCDNFHAAAMGAGNVSSLKQTCGTRSRCGIMVCGGGSDTPS